MRSWISIYCAKKADDLTAIMIDEGIHAADFSIIAKYYNVDFAIVNATLSALKVEDYKQGSFLIRYSDTIHPTLVARWSERDVENIVPYVNELLAKKSESLVSEVQNHVRYVTDVITMEIRHKHPKDLGIILGMEAARYLAKELIGIIENPDGDWFRIGNEGGLVAL